jgi:hypothetical protein
MRPQSERWPMSAAIPTKRAEVHRDATYARARHCALAVHRPGQNEGEPVHLQWLVSGPGRRCCARRPIVRSPTAAQQIRPQRTLPLGAERSSTRPLGGTPDIAARLRRYTLLVLQHLAACSVTPPCPRADGGVVGLPRPPLMGDRGCRLPRGTPPRQSHGSSSRAIQSTMGETDMAVAPGAARSVAGASGAGANARGDPI